MVELNTPATLMDDQMGHADGSVQAHYAHAAGEMVLRLMTGLTKVWENALAARRELHHGSPVAVLDKLLRTKIVSQATPREIQQRKWAGPHFAKPTLTCCFMIGLTRFEPATP
jgi:hypothetical protein